MTGYAVVLDSIWLHVRACGHWTRRVYDLFRGKLQQEHGATFDDNSNFHFRTSMRSRMSKSYIDGLRGSTSKATDPTAGLPRIESLSHSCCQKSEEIQIKVSSLSLPQIDHATILPTHSGHSTLSLREYRDAHHSTDLYSNANKSVHIDSDLAQAGAASKNQRLTVPPIGDYCVRMSNTSTVSERHEGIELNESRGSDALGYMRMYQNHNRVQFNTLQFNDREDLQVLIDGPYGAPSQHIFEAEHAVLIAAGIGITPFASILQSIMCRYRNLRHKCPSCEHIWDNPQDTQPFVKKVMPSLPVPERHRYVCIA